MYVTPEPVLDETWEDGKVTVWVEKQGWTWVAKQRGDISGPWPWQSCGVAPTREQAIVAGLRAARENWPEDT